MTSLPGQHVSLVERTHRSSLGPLLRSCESVLRSVIWRRRGAHPPAPPHIKRKMLASYVDRFHPAVFVETGTYRGDTVAKLVDHVQRVVSIELDPTLAGLARRRFAGKSKVTILQGDSAEELPRVISELHELSLLWLDGHYSGGVTADSGESPIMRELAAALSADQPHVILVDDIRLFDGSDGYPTLDQVLALVGASDHHVRVQTEHDVLRIVPVALAT